MAGSADRRASHIGASPADQRIEARPASLIPSRLPERRVNALIGGAEVVALGADAQLAPFSSANHRISYHVYHGADHRMGSQTSDRSSFAVISSVI